MSELFSVSQASIPETGSMTSTGDRPRRSIGIGFILNLYERTRTDDLKSQWSTGDET
jgi:hypothetical protein